MKEESRGGLSGRVQESGEKEFLVGMLQGWAWRVMLVDCLVGLRVLRGQR